MAKFHEIKTSAAQTRDGGLGADARDVITMALQYMDKACLTGAAMFGILTDLDLVQLSVATVAVSYCTMIFYWGYLLGSEFLTFVLIVRVLMRFFLGFCKASVSPAFSLITAMWYRCATSVWGIALWFLLPANPMTARFLTPELRKVAILRIASEQIGIENQKTILLIGDVGAVGFVSLLTSGVISVFVLNMRVYLATFACFPKIVPLWGMYLMGFSPVVYVMTLSLATANKAGHTKKSRDSGAAPRVRGGSRPAVSTTFTIVIAGAAVSAAVLISLLVYLKRGNAKRDRDNPVDEDEVMATALLDWMIVDS
ncbi:hypothetical protein BJX70DRAFT_394259 [Aspergillus crustosus]